MAHIIIPVVVGLIALVLGLLVGYILRKSIGEKTIGNAETTARNMLLDAEKMPKTSEKKSFWRQGKRPRDRGTTPKRKLGREETRYQRQKKT